MNASHWSDLPLVLTSKQAAAVLQVQSRTVAGMLDRGDLHGIKIGNEWRISRAELMRFVLDAPAEGGGNQDAAAAERAPVIVDKDGVLVIEAEPLGDLDEFVRQERNRRVYPALVGKIVAPPHRP